MSSYQWKYGTNLAHRVLLYRSLNNFCSIHYETPCIYIENGEIKSAKMYGLLSASMLSIPSQTLIIRFLGFITESLASVILILIKEENITKIK